MIASLGSASENAPCRIVRHLDQDYAVCSADPAVSDISIFHRDRHGTPYGAFAPLKADLLHDGKRLDVAVNGGMYESDLSPVGLLVIDGVERKPIANGEGWGNFYLLPNGVFALSDGKAMVMETQTYRQAAIVPQMATQSGPMLVIDGAIHPAFKPGSDSLQIRNGVGVDAAGVVYLAIALKPVRFHDFATLFRDALDCPNALFLDGHISSLYAPDLGRIDEAHPIGPIIAITTPMWHGAVR